MARAKEKTASIGVRTSPERRAAWEAAAKADGYPLSVWIARRVEGMTTTAPLAAPAEPSSSRKRSGR